MENKNKGDLEKAARSKLGSYKMDPPESAWNALDAELDKKQARLMTKKANRFKMLSIALLLLLISFVSFYYLIPSDNSLHTSEVPDNRMEASDVNPLPGNKANRNSELHNGNSEKTALQNSQKTISAVNKNKSVGGYQNNFHHNKNLVAGKKILNSKKHSIVPVQNGTDDSNEVLNFNNADNTNAGENVVLLTIHGDSETVTETAPFAEAETISTDVIERTDSSLTKLLYKEDSVTKGRISIALFYSPDYCWTILKDNTSDTIDDAAMFNDRENSDFSFSTGISLKYDLNDRWSLVSGITYSTLAKSITLQTMYAHSNSANEMHIMYPTSSGMIEILAADVNPAMNEGDSIITGSDGRQLVKFISVPLMVRVQSTKKRFTWFANGGFSVNFIVQEKTKVKMESTEMNIVNHIEGLNKMNYGYLFGAGVQYRIFNSMDLFTEPVFRGSFTSITHDTAVKSFPYTFGLHTGILFRF